MLTTMREGSDRLVGPLLSGVRVAVIIGKVIEAQRKRRLRGVA